MSDEEEDDDGDLFADSEKEGGDIEDIEENVKSVSVITTFLSRCSLILTLYFCLFGLLSF